MRIRAISVPAVAIGLLGALASCVTAPAPSCPAAALLATPSNPPAPANAATPVQAPPAAPALPVSAAPREPAFPAAQARNPALSDIELDYAAPWYAAPQQFSGSSAAPSAGRTAARRGERRRPAGRHRGWDLDETQIEAQWVNPPLGAGE